MRSRDGSGLVVTRRLLFPASSPEQYVECPTTKRFPRSLGGLLQGLPVIVGNSTELALWGGSALRRSADWIFVWFVSFWHDTNYLVS